MVRVRVRVGVGLRLRVRVRASPQRRVPMVLDRVVLTGHEGEHGISRDADRWLLAV